MKPPKVTEKLINKISKKLSNAGYMPSGVCSSFYKIDKDWGAKIYYDDRTRDAAYNAQKKAARHKLGPKVGEKFKVKYGYSATGYCFITRRAIKVGRTGHYEGSTKHTNLYLKLRKLKLHKAAKDLHYMNYGLIGNRLVCIDFMY